ncbi:hypothetical protein FISHEDRAFT_61768 [Fistulina hepatica ATCC 64428]|uniref:DUF5667 domain-containing protein n=1 Tax=Fistulina hepatica ATCC 64428 TaxID=1128425 RepID=A0A0D7A121_9AGAR|nr:hypothetical protein FISHEDRAFT_61768 [Fistulina hepatica ATCC 64428]
MRPAVLAATIALALTSVTATTFLDGSNLKARAARHTISMRELADAEIQARALHDAAMQRRAISEPLVRARAFSNVIDARGLSLQEASEAIEARNLYDEDPKARSLLNRELHARQQLGEILEARDILAARTDEIGSKPQQLRVRTVGQDGELRPRVTFAIPDGQNSRRIEEGRNRSPPPPFGADTHSAQPPPTYDHATSGQHSGRGSQQSGHGSQQSGDGPRQSGGGTQQSSHNGGGRRRRSLSENDRRDLVDLDVRQASEYLNTRDLELEARAGAPPPGSPSRSPQRRYYDDLD